MEINIAYGANEKYSEYAYISILSALKNLKGHHSINCYLITTRNNKRIKTFKNLKKIYSNFQFNDIIINDDNIKDIQMSKKHHITYHCFYRFYINKINGINKIIYLDCDTLVLGNIINLYNEDISNDIAGVVSDIPLYEEKKRIQSLHLNKNKYFNSGIMLINLDKRKEYKVSEQGLDLISKNKYQCGDQDALNIILENKCKYLEGIYNVQTQFFELNKDNFQEIGFNLDYYEHAIKNPQIVHFTLSIKPRDLISNHPYQNNYDKMRWFAIFCNLKYLKLFPMKGKDYLILFIHTIEDILFQKYETKKNVRFYINKVLKIFNNKE